MSATDLITSNISLSLHWDIKGLKKKSLLIRIVRNFPYIWQCWQLSHSANKKFPLLYLCWRAQTTIPPVYQHPWLDWDPGFNGFVASICPVQSIGAQVQWGQTQRRTRHEGYPFKDSLFSPISRRQAWLFQLPGIQIYWKIKPQTLERKPLSLDFKDSWTFVLICNNQFWDLSLIGVALTFDPLWSISKVARPSCIPELISRSPGCVSWQRLHSIQYRFGRKLPLDATVLIDKTGRLRGRTEANLVETFIIKTKMTVFI